MEVVAATPSSGGVPPFRDHDVREWSRIDSITGALERARIETDHWSANTINSSHKYGKVVDSRARTDAEGGLHQTARRQLEVFHSQIPGGRLHVVKTHTVATSKWTNKDGGLLGGNKDFENLQLPLNPLDLTPQKSKATVGRSVARRPPTRQHLKDPTPPVIDYTNPLRHAHITASTNLHRVSRLCHQIHDSAVKQAFGRRSPRPAINNRRNGDGSVEIYEIESVSSENTNTTNGHTNLVRTKSSSSDDINLIPEKDIGNNKSAEDLEDLEELQSWRRTSKIRRSLQFPKHNQPIVSTKPPDLPENSGSVRKIREDLEKGRRLNTALRNNSVDLEALDQILQSISGSSTSSEKTPDDESESPRKQKRNSFVTVESLQEVKGRLRRTSSPTSDIYKEDEKDEDPDDGIVTEETPSNQDKEMPLLEQSRVRSYVYGMESLLNKKPGIGTGSLESRVKLINSNTTNRNEDWYNRRKSYGFEQVHNHNNAANSISHKNKNLVESSTDSGICRSTEIVVAPSPAKKNGYMSNERCTSDEHSDTDQKYNNFEAKNYSGTHFGQMKKLTNTFTDEDRPTYYNKSSTSNGSWTKYSSDWSNLRPEIKSTTITIPIAKNNNIVDLSWNNDSDKDIKRHSIAVDESKYVTNNVDPSKYRRTSLALNDQFLRQDEDDSNTRKTKKVEFCKTEVHFAAESGKVNIVATDEKPPPTQNFRRRRRNSGPTLDEFNKNGLPVLHFGDSSYEKTMFGVSDEPDPNSADENSQLNASFGLVTVNTTNSINNEITDDDKKELTENEIKGILKNKPIKPRPYHLGETVPFNESNSDEDNKWGVRLRHVDKPETPIWKSTVTVHNYNYFDKPPSEASNGAEPEFQKLLKSLRPIRKSDYTSDNDNRYLDTNIDNRRSSWSAADAKPAEDSQAVENKGYSTKINFEEGEATVVESDSYDVDRHTTWPRADNLGKDSKQLLNKGLVVRIGREDSALNHTVCSKMTTTQDTNNTTTTTKITIDLSPSPPTKNDSCFTYAKYQGSHSHSFKSTSLILNTIKDKSEKTAEKNKDEIPKQLEALKKLYEDIQSDSDADKEVQQLMSKVSLDNSNKIETDTSSEVSGSWSKMRAYKNMSDHFGRSSVKEATARYDLKSGAKVVKEYTERLKPQERDLPFPNRDNTKFNINLNRHNSSPVAVRNTVAVSRPDLKPTEQLSSPSIVNKNKIVEPLTNGRISPIKDFKMTVDKKLQTKHSSDSIVLRQPRKSEMTYFGVNLSPKPMKKISQAVIRKENKLSEKPDLIQHYKDSSPRNTSKQSKPGLKFPENPSDQHVYENIKNQYSKEFDSSILDELTKAADQIMQAVNEYTDEDIYNRLNSDDEEDSKKKQLETIVETKSWKQEKVTAKTKTINSKTKLKPTSSTSSVESVNRRKATSDQKTKTVAERQRRNVEKTEQISTKAANTKARRLQRASSREALLHSHGSSSEDLQTNVELPLRKPRLIKKTKVTQLTMTNGVEMKKSPSSTINRRREDVGTKGEERILGSLPEIRHKTAVSTIRSTSEKTTRDKTRHRSEDVRKKTPVKREATKVSNPSSRMETAKSNRPATHNRETVTHRISTAYVPVCRNRSRDMHARQRDTDCPCLCS